jgi:hypothetical protein
MVSSLAHFWLGVMTAITACPALGCVLVLVCLPQVGTVSLLLGVLAYSGG